jgi:hypothetical protein
LDEVGDPVDVIGHCSSPQGFDGFDCPGLRGQDEARCVVEWQIEQIT